ncbi:MAG TPA: glucose 1-dehydrogenase [Candidatus Deferrimicrobiaceae bacterium]
MRGQKRTDLASLFTLRGKTAIVTGGSIGVGEQICHGLAEAGANVVVCARNVARCEELAHTLEDRYKVSALAVRCDVSDERDVESVVAEAVGKYRGIDVLVNNAGITWGAEYHEMSLKHWQKVLDTNLNGTFLFCKHAGKQMIPRQSGKVINISSILGMYGHRTLTAPSYTASKAAINGFTLDLAVKWARYNITVNAIAPGWYPSNMTGSVMKKMNDALLAPIPLGRYLRDSDIKGVVVFLAAPASDFITGQVIVVDGGEML